MFSETVCISVHPWLKSPSSQFPSVLNLNSFGNSGYFVACWGLCPQTPEVFEGMARRSMSRKGGLERDCSAGLRGVIDAPSVRVSLAELLFSSAPLCFPERSPRYMADRDPSRRYGKGSSDRQEPRACRTVNCISKFWGSRRRGPWHVWNWT